MKTQIHSKPCPWDRRVGSEVKSARSHRVLRSDIHTEAPAIYNSSSGKSHTIFWPLQAAGTHVVDSRHVCHKHTINKSKIKIKTFGFGFISVLLKITVSYKFLKSSLKDELINSCDHYIRKPK